jgi:membrane-associated phospholipid phosphatase
VKFVWARITPGDLGLELTTALAVAGVGAYVFVAYLVAVDSNPGPTAMDSSVLDLANRTRTDFGVSLAKVLSVIGSLPVVGGLTVIGAVLLGTRRRPIELVVLVASVVLIYAAVHITKGAVGRPRPPHPLTSAAGSAYPSAHAAYSTTYVAMAVIAARVLPGLASRATLVFVSIALAAAIGASRVFLEVHWASDVAGGWGLGAAIFGLVGAGGLIVGYVRHNGMSAEPPDGPATHEPVPTVGN